MVGVAVSSLTRILGECSTIHSPPALFFLKWRLAPHINSTLLCQDQSTVAQRAKTTVIECSLTVKLRVSSFPDRFPHYAWTGA